jgi:ribosomal protein S18 acetylase RimI-like enzyme
MTGSEAAPDVHVVIRPMEADDLDAALAVIDANDPTLSDIARYEVRDAFFERPREQFFYTADAGGQVIGLMGGMRDIWSVDDVWWVNWLYIAPAWHRRGIGHMLYTRIEESLLARGCRKVYLDVGNEAEHGSAIAFHLAHGFAREGYLKDYWEDGEDFLIFGKRLRDAASAEAAGS